MHETLTRQTQFESRLKLVKKKTTLEFHKINFQNARFSLISKNVVVCEAEPAFLLLLLLLILFPLFLSVLYLLYPSPSRHFPFFCLIFVSVLLLSLSCVSFSFVFASVLFRFNLWSFSSLLSLSIIYIYTYINLLFSTFMFFRFRRLVFIVFSSSYSFRSSLLSGGKAIKRGSATPLWHACRTLFFSPSPPHPQIKLQGRDDREAQPNIPPENQTRS